MSAPPMSNVCVPLYRAADVRALDRAVIAAGVPGADLMRRAATAALARLRARWPRARRLLVLCGIGNNGGDGYVLARLANEQGLQVRLVQVGDVARLQGDASSAAQAWRAQGGVVEGFAASLLAEQDVVVDGLFGTGLDRPMAGEWRTVIDAVNAAHRPLLALDIPSGLHADTGQALGYAMRATLTVSFLTLKPGLYTGSGPDYCGQVVLDDLGVTVSDHAWIAPCAEIIDKALVAASLPRRSRITHKGNCGHVLLIGGDHGMAGAVQLAATAAARAGAGLVSVATRAVHARMISVQQPELMCHGVDTPAALSSLLARATVVAIGPGLGQSDWGRAMLARVLEADLPLLVDADALNLLAQDPVRRRDWILTPHPGEAARLLAQTTAQVQSDRLTAVQSLAERYGGTVVLKGAGSLIADDGALPRLCTAGNPGMASGGMGDLLCGVIAALRAQGLTGFDAASIGVCIHAMAADRAAAAGERGLLASDLLAHLRRLLNPVLAHA